MFITIKTSLLFIFLFVVVLSPFASFCTTANVVGMKATKEKDTITNEQLIPRSLLFGDLHYSSIQISPDAQYLSFLAPHNGVLNIWAGQLNDLKTVKPITQNKKHGVSSYHWSYNNQSIIYFDDEGGNENWRCHRVDIQTGKIAILAALDKVQIRFFADSPSYPNEILIGINQRKSQFHDIYRLNVLTGEQSLVYENNSFFNFVFDKNLNVHLGAENTPDGGTQFYHFKPDLSMNKLFKIDNEDILTTFTLASLSKNADTLYFLDSRNRNTSALVALDLKTQKSKVIAQNNQADISNVLFHPTELTIQGYASNYIKHHWTIVDKNIKNDIDYLKKQTKGELEILHRSLDDSIWLVRYYTDNAPPQYYYYNRNQHKSFFLFSGSPKLDSMPLTQMQPVIIPSRDHLSLVSYLSLPNNIRNDKGLAKQPIPMVLLVHGGPNTRNKWGYDSLHQWLSNRGYAVLSVNYRGSTGFGKKFANAGNGEWGGKMQTDLLDAVDWAVKHRITTPDKVAIMGRSYGGYATLVAMTKTPNVFVCGIDSVGISNLETFIQSIPSYWKPYAARMKTLIGGDPDTEQGRSFLASRSPIHFVKNITKPLLIEQGGNDPRVKQMESEQIVAAMKANHIPVTYVLYPDEGHSFKRPANRFSTMAIEEAFLAQHLGGQFEPIQNDFKNSSLQIKEGKQFIDALAGRD